MTTFVMGDIHGNYRGLLQCLKESNFDYENDTLIQLGDVCDGWSETSECVDELLKIKNLFSIRGNHDVWCYDWFNYGRTPNLWTQQGGKATIDSYMRTEKFLTQSHKDFWNNQIDWYIDNDNRLFIHGGWDYIAPTFEQGVSYTVKAGSIAKECHWNRSLLMGAKAATLFNKKNGSFKALKKFKEIYIGHTAEEDHKVHNYLNLWNMDSGSGWNGRLSIMNIDTKEIWYSDFSKDLYPNEKGR